MKWSMVMRVGVFTVSLVLSSPALAQKAGTTSTCPSGSVKVGPLCVDKYEASVWSTSTGGTRYGAMVDDYPCDNNGNNCKGKIYARSVAGVTPSRFINWFQAQQACANAGKRLLTNAEWQMAAAGTPDGAPCVVSSGGPGSTGTSGCVSAWGAFDMVGNLWEWVADWVAPAAACTTSLFSTGDFNCLAGVDDFYGPAALLRGGSFNDGTSAGVFALTGTSQPSGASVSVGFRCGR